MDDIKLIDAYGNENIYQGIDTVVLQTEAGGQAVYRSSSGGSKFAENVDGSLTGVSAADLPNITTVREYAFAENYSLTSVELPGTVTQIGGGAFSNCFSLVWVDFGSGVQLFGGNVLTYDNLALEYVIIRASTPPTTWEEYLPAAGVNSFDLPSTIRFYVPAASLAAYQANAHYNQYDLRSIDDLPTDLANS